MVKKPPEVIGADHAILLRREQRLERVRAASVAAGIAGLTVGGQHFRQTAQLAAGLPLYLLATSSMAAALLITVANQNSVSSFTLDWTMATQGLIGRMTPNSYVGNFQMDSAGGVTKLTDGAIGAAGSVNGPSTNNGYDLTHITFYSNTNAPHI